ncbi:MAG TPA: ABC transporter ATP-binding protein [Candidatus Gallacutalibacter stercoravium]|nr:ABC transporter ATP-binding protein [Candidatus Gallacutalibacter stercoravium]
MKPKKREQSYVGRMMKDVMHYWNWYLLSVVSTAAYLVLDIYIRNATGQITDAALAGSGAFVPLLLCMLGAYLAAAPFHGMSTYTKAMMSQRMMRDLRIRMGEKVTRVSLPKLALERSGDIISRLGYEMELLDDFVYYGLSFVTTLVVQSLGTLAVMLYIDWQLALVLVAGALVSLPVCYRLSLRVGKRTYLAQQALGRASQSAQQGFGALDIVKSFQSEERVKEQYAQEVNSALGQELKSNRQEAWMNIAGEILGLLPLFAMLCLGAGRVIGGTLTVGNLMSLSMVGASFCHLLKGTPDNLIYLQKAASSCRRIYSFLDLPEESAGGERLPQNSESAVTFSNVGFSYTEDAPGGENTLDSLHFEVKKNQTLALVGASGSGKSTVLRLICGFITVQQGSVEVLGRPVEQWNVAALRQNIGMVLQESYLFPGSIRENLLAAKEGASDEELLRVCALAGVSEFIKERGLDTPVGERGGQLSGGERQRIAVARALLKDAPLLLLDEPTSALDPVSEQAVNRGLLKLMEGRTTIIASHRLSLVQRADQILVLEKGRVVQRGTHEQLLRDTGGLYARLHAEQNAEEARG